MNVPGSDDKQFALKAVEARVSANAHPCAADTRSDGGKTWSVSYDLTYLRKK
jgi:hypothetical protein